LQASLVATLIVMTAFAIVRRLANKLEDERPAVFDNLGVLWHYTVVQALLGLLLVHGLPHLLS
jgi:cytochrome c oxidase subunit I+III